MKKDAGEWDGRRDDRLENEQNAGNLREESEGRKVGMWVKGEKWERSVSEGMMENSDGGDGNHQLPFHPDQHNSEKAIYFAFFPPTYFLSSPHDEEGEIRW